MASHEYHKTCCSPSRSLETRCDAFKYLTTLNLDPLQHAEKNAREFQKPANKELKGPRTHIHHAHPHLLKRPQARQGLAPMARRVPREASPLGAGNVWGFGLACATPLFCRRSAGSFFSNLASRNACAVQSFSHGAAVEAAIPTASKLS